MIRRLLALVLLLPSLAWATYPSTILADQPIHYYHVNESSGTTATDVGTGPINGTYTSTFSLSQTPIPGYPGDHSVSFTGNATDGYINMTNDATFFLSRSANDTWSFEVWLYPSSVATTWGVVGATNSGSSNNSIWSLLLLSTPAWRFRVFNTGGTCTSAYGTIEGGTPIANAWNYITVTTKSASATDLTHMRLYINGALFQESTTFSGALCTSTPGLTAVGTDPPFIGTGANNYGGRVDEPAFYRVQNGAGGELTATQVLTHYLAGNTVPPSQWPYTVRAPQLPRFRDGDYWKKFVDAEYNTGLFSKRFFTIGYPGFEVVPNGNF